MSFREIRQDSGKSVQTGQPVCESEEIKRGGKNENIMFFFVSLGDILNLLL